MFFVLILAADWSLIVQIRQKVPFVLISTDIQTCNSQPLQFQFPPSKTQLKTQHLLASNRLKSHCNSPLHHNPDSPKIPKKLFNLGSSRYLNSFPSKSTGFLPSFRVGIENFLLEESFPRAKISIIGLCIRVLTVRKLRKVLNFFISFRLPTYFPQPLQVRIAPSQTLSSTKNTTGGTFRRKIIVFICCIRILIVRIFRKNYFL